MNSSLRKVALVGGSGHLGPSILQALQSDPTTFDVTVISRHSSQALFPPSTKVLRVSDDYPPDEMVSAFRGHDAVVLSLNFAAEFQHHSALVDASIEAGVKRLIPSVWAGRIDVAEAREIFPLAAVKYGVLEYVRRRAVECEGWSWTSVSTGLFSDLCLETNFYGLDPSTHTAKIWGDGTAKFSATTHDSIGLAVAAILKSHPAETKNKDVYISSFDISLNDLLAAYKSATGVSDWTINTGDVDEGIEEAKRVHATSSDVMEKMRAMGLLGLLVGLKEGLGADFTAAGVVDNEMLGVPRGDLEQAVVRALKK
ncbi:unnamed protein product [Periconia digitata]|uniref:NmrA-like domain-containing protein n=1 Tax=Periconia digitata TaxID=1303443 RepID=A0A9W4UJM1_9PLEO|nr:unnamed protein product [Periconia digitata]